MTKRTLARLVFWSLSIPIAIGWCDMLWDMWKAVGWWVLGLPASVAAAFLWLWASFHAFSKD